MADGTSAATHAQESRHSPSGTRVSQQPAAPVVQEPMALLEELLPLGLSVQRATAEPRELRPAEVLALQRAAGNRAVSHLIQTKLTVGPANDSHEQEADRVAEQVLNMPARVVQSTGDGQVQRQEDEDELQFKPLVQRQEDEEEVQTKQGDRGGDGGAFDAGAAVESRLAAGKGSGAPLPGETRTFMESRFGTDFSDVRLHTDGEASDLNRSLSAQAFTHGHDIYMPAERFSPGTAAGDRLLAHELTHVVQQSGQGLSKAQPLTLQRTPLRKEQILAGLDAVPTLHDLLSGGSLLGQSELTHTTTAPTDQAYLTARTQEQRLGRGELRQGMTLRAHIEQLLDNYEAQFQGKADDIVANAIKIAAALTAVGKALSRKVHAPYEQAKISRELVTVFAAQIKTALRTGAEVDQSVEDLSFGMVTAMVSDDPVGLFMQNKVSLYDAAMMIVQRAAEARMTPASLFRLLSQQYQLEMGSYTLDQVAQGERAKLAFAEGAFDLKNAYGEISQEYFQAVAQLDKRNRPKWKKGGQGLALKAGKAKALKQLEDEVRTRSITAPPGPVVPVPGLTGAQSAYLHGLTTRENDETANARAALRKFFGGVFTSRTTADARIQACLNAIAHGTYAIAFKPDTVFPDVGSIASRTEFQHYFEVKTRQMALGGMGGLIPGSTESIDVVPPDQRRGPDYSTFRFEKDVRATGQAAIPARDLSRYGALQVVADTKDLFTIDVYGDFSLILDPTQFAGRMVYAIEHGIERKDPLLLLADMAKNPATRGLLWPLARGEEMRTTKIEFHIFGSLPFNHANIRKLQLGKGYQYDAVSGLIAGGRLTRAEQQLAMQDTMRDHGGDPNIVGLYQAELIRRLGVKNAPVQNTVNAALSWGLAPADILDGPPA